jgi:hypothetical protein
MQTDGEIEMLSSPSSSYWHSCARASNFGGKLCVETEIRDQNLDEDWVKRPSTVNSRKGTESNPSLRLGIVVSPTSWIFQSITVILCQECQGRAKRFWAA